MQFKESNVNEARTYLSANFGILDLRDIASEMGVKQPSTFKKEPLVDEMLKLATGELQPYIKIKEGRRIMGQRNYRMINDAIREMKAKLGDPPAQQAQPPQPHQPAQRPQYQPYQQPQPSQPPSYLAENPVVEKLPLNGTSENWGGAEVREGVL